ncbi:MAG: hypothetical protein K0U93_02120, partial [Gammaproteobacteria bacterium]|nr:hypothetical protein [Gammaproteobacteria bacterium]
SMREDGFKQYRRTYLDEAFPTLARAFRAWADKGVLVPQFHGLEHCNGDGLCALAREEDERIQEHALDATQPWWDWEELESPFQGHYVDGTHLPSKPVDAATQAFLVREGLSRFASVFGFQPTSAVAPCYLWNDDTEQEWSKGGIRYIQTAGYRCTGRDAQGTYFQDKPWLTFGSRNGLGQMYLVRNTMFEPTDGRGVQGALEEARAAYVQGLPIVISTHRYNFTRSEDAHRDSLRQFAQLLNGLRELGALRYLSSPELGAWVDTPDAPLVHPATGAVWPPLNARSGIAKVSAFLLRLWYRHPKLRVVACVTGLIVPGFLLISATRRNG